MTEALDDRPTIAERYVRATATSNLKLETHRFSDADLVAAAGLVAANPDAHKRRRLKLGGLLYRLVGEYDAVRGEAIAAERRLNQAQEQADAIAKTAKKLPAAKAEEAKNIAQAIREERERRAVTDHLMILSELKTLREAANELGFFAEIQATKKRLEKTPKEVARLSSLVLDMFLDPKCRNCTGLGFLGSAHRGEMQTICSHCKGSTRRISSFGRDRLDKSFAEHLLCEMEGMISDFEVAVGINIRNS
jgi:hypothetical protein